MNKFKSLIGGVALSVALATSALAAGVDINASSTGLAMQGYDPVAYFTVGEATKGDYRITALHDDALYRFSSGSSCKQVAASRIVTAIAVQASVLS